MERRIFPVSEFSEQRWAVMSERGVEATALGYVAARQLMLRLVREKVSGLSVITSDAAGRASQTEKSQGGGARKQGRLPDLRD